MSSHDDDRVTNTSPNTHIDEVITARLESPARRGLLRGGLGLGTLTFVGASAGLAGCCGGGEDSGPTAISAAPSPTTPTTPMRPAAMSARRRDSFSGRISR